MTVSETYMDSQTVTEEMSKEEKLAEEATLVFKKVEISVRISTRSSAVPPYMQPILPLFTVLQPYKRVIIHLPSGVDYELREGQAEVFCKELSIYTAIEAVQKRIKHIDRLTGGVTGVYTDHYLQQLEEDEELEYYRRIVENISYADHMGREWKFGAVRWQIWESIDDTLICKLGPICATVLCPTIDVKDGSAIYLGSDPAEIPLDLTDQVEVARFYLDRVKTFLSHEAEEFFKYEGVVIFDPHKESQSVNFS